MGKSDSEIREEINRLLRVFFKHTPEKIEVWLNTPNLNFGGCSPNKLIQLGRGHKVLAFVKEAAESWLFNEY
jgi:hypothetical protein